MKLPFEDPTHRTEQARSPRARPVLAALLLAGCLAGCATYQIGNRSLYPQDVHTVYLPIFESDSFRRNLGERLTEAVSKEIPARTPYRVVGSSNADSVLTGRIVAENKRVIAENRYDDPRKLEVNLRVSVSWIDRNGGILCDGSVPLPPELTSVGGNAAFVPEYGQSVATAHQQAIQRVAEQIVGMMESPW